MRRQALDANHARFEPSRCFGDNLRNPARIATLTQTTPFARALLDWCDQHGRKHLPWQQNATPYRVWVSEIMLQQTQVDTVIPYFERFMACFPDVATLADASLDEVLRRWAGLGYYARARNLHKAAQRIVAEMGGDLPADPACLESLPGIGRSTAAAILALAFGQRAAILDGNVKRVLARYHGVDGWPGHSAVNRRLWELAEKHTPGERVAAYTQGIMDLGATLCRRSRPDCARCPVSRDCKARRSGEPERWPGKKPRTARPVKHRQLLILRNRRGEILLEKRPAQGVWGGLWSLPEIDPRTDIEEAVETRYQLRLKRWRKEPPIRHPLTHFELSLTPIHAEIDAPSGVKEMANRQTLWYNPQQSPPGGLPAPIAKLLARRQNR